MHRTRASQRAVAAAATAALAATGLTLASQPAAAVPPATEATIAEVQGAAHRSPLEGEDVVVEGVVTVVSRSGFWIQSTSPDGDPATSEGLFVFRGTAAAGDRVQVEGTVTEFRPGGVSNANLTITELTSPETTVVSRGNALPAATVIGLGGRVPPTEVIEDDASGDVETSGAFDPANDGIDFYESLEGMRVQVNDAVAVGPTNDFGEIPVLTDDGAYASVRTSRGGIVVRDLGPGSGDYTSGDFNPERVILDDALIPFRTMPAVDVRDRFPGATLGVLDYSFGNFKLLVTAPPTAQDGGLQREVTGAAEKHELSVATYNVENLDPSDDTFDDHARLIVNNLRSPDILTIEEVQDNDGSANSGTTDATLTWEKLIAAIQAAGGPAYDVRDIDPLDDQDGGQPGGNIRVGFLFRTDRGLEFVDRPGGDATTPTRVVPTEGGEHRYGHARLTLSPGRVQPNDPAWEDSRKPLAGEFRYRNRTVFVIANHWASKGGDDPLFGRFQPPTRSSEIQRVEQARVVAGFVEEILSLDKHAQVIVAGDLNDFDFSPAVQRLVAVGLIDLPATLPLPERYTYVFDGNSQVLDHLLLSPRLAQRHYEYDIVHVNSEFADQVSDHEPQVVRIKL